MTKQARYLHEIFGQNRFHVKHQYALEGKLHVELVTNASNVSMAISINDKVNYYVHEALSGKINGTFRHASSVETMIVCGVYHDEVSHKVGCTAPECNVPVMVHLILEKEQ